MRNDLNEFVNSARTIPCHDMFRLYENLLCIFRVDYEGSAMASKTNRTKQETVPFRKNKRHSNDESKIEAASSPRIIGGDLKGRRLAFHPGGPTRPMKDRVREMTFDLLGTSVRNATAIDLFAGTGALGFEALSRGAQRAFFAERHFPTVDCLSRSSRDLGLVDRCTVIPGDVLLWPRRMPALSFESPWIIFVSPPWSFFHSRIDEINVLLQALAGIAPAASRLVVESDDQMAVERLPARFGVYETEGPWDSRSMPPAVLHQKCL